MAKEEGNTLSCLLLPMRIQRADGHIRPSGRVHSRIQPAIHMPHHSILAQRGDTNPQTQLYGQVCLPGIWRLCHSMTRTSRYLIGESVKGRSTPSDVIYLRLLYHENISVRGDVQIFPLLCLAFSGCQPNIIYNDNAIGPIRIDNDCCKVYPIRAQRDSSSWSSMF